MNQPLVKSVLKGMADRLAKGDLTAAEQHHMSIRLRHLAEQLKK